MIPRRPRRRKFNASLDVGVAAEGAGALLYAHEGPDAPDPVPLDLILGTLRQRRALCDVVLATYRVELTGTLSRIARGRGALGDVAKVGGLAKRIAGAAEAARLESVLTDARALEQQVAVMQHRGKVAEGSMLMAGLKVIDGILDAGTFPRTGSGAPASHELN